MFLAVNQRIFLRMKVEIQSKVGYKIVDLNRRRAIREKCLNCAGWIPKEVSMCGFVDCSLSPFRSGRGKQNPKLRKKAIRRYCLWCLNGRRSEIAKCALRECPLFAFRMSNVDRSAKIESLLKMDDIEGLSGYRNLLGGIR
jgi:hypothetical protein